MEILRNIHFTDNIQKLPSKDSMEYDRYWKTKPLFDHLQKHFQAALDPKSHQVTAEQIRGQKHYEAIHKEETHQMGVQVLASMLL